MADYRIANIKWLRGKGWSIPSSYADSMCPTYNEIVNEIPKGSITVDVSGTYSNNQLVCEKDINIITGKFVTLALSNGNVIDIEGSGALTTSMVRDYQQTTVKAEIGTLCTSLEGSVFTSFENLTGATISDTVTSIGINPFVNCTSLTSIIIDSNNTTYDSRNNCNAIIKTSTNTLIQGCKSTVIPNTVTSIGQNAFMAQKTLTGITIPNSVTSIDVSAFQACEGLTNMVIPTSVTTIGNDAFSGCKNITTCTMGNGVTSIGSGAFAGCTSLTSITLSNTLETINSGAFAGCTSLPSITIPESVTNIGGGVLTACTSLERITVERVEPPTITNYTFDSSNDCPIYVPCESVNTYKTSWSRYADRITCDSVDCDAYDFNVEEDYFNYDETEGDIATTTSSMPQLTATVKSGFITNPITVRKDGDYYYYSATFSENTGNPFSRSAVIEFTDGKGCVFSEDVGQGGVGCESYYGFNRETSEVSSDSGRYLIATSDVNRIISLSPTITEGSSFLTEVEVFQNLTKYEYYGHFNPNTSTSPRTAEIIYRSYQVDGCVFRQTIKQEGKEAPQNSIIVKKRIERAVSDSSCVGNLVEDDLLIVSCTFKITQSGYHSYTKNVSYVYDNLSNLTISIPLTYEGVNVESVYITDLTFGGTTPYVYVYECGGDETRPLLLQGSGTIDHNILYYEKLDYERVCVAPIGGSPCTDLDELYTSFELRYDDSKGIYTIYMDNSVSPTT